MKNRIDSRAFISSSDEDERPPVEHDGKHLNQFTAWIQLIQSDFT